MYILTSCLSCVKTDSASMLLLCRVAKTTFHNLPFIRLPWMDANNTKLTDFQINQILWQGHKRTGFRLHSIYCSKATSDDSPSCPEVITAAAMKLLGGNSKSLTENFSLWMRMNELLLLVAQGRNTTTMTKTLGFSRVVRRRAPLLP